MIAAKKTPKGWKIIYDEAITPSKNATLWLASDDPASWWLWERNDDGLYYSYYTSVWDAFHGQKAKANYCYGWVTLKVEKGEFDAFMTNVLYHDGEPLVCDHPETCAEIFHAGQVALGNEDEDNCAVCARYLTNQNV